MAVNINGDTGIDKVQPGSVDGVDLSDGSVSSPKLDTNIAVTGTLSAGGNISTPTGTVTASSFSGDGSSLTGIAGGFSNMDVFTSPGTWTNPGNVQKVKVTVTGGGGGTAIQTNTIAPGGGTSSFGAYCSASGGAGGGEGPSANKGTGGIGSGGNINIRGGGGTFPYNRQGIGGASYWGGGSRAGSPVAGAYGGGSGGNQCTGGGGGGTAIEVISFPSGTNVPVTIGGAGTNLRPNDPAYLDYVGTAGAGVVVVEY